MKIIKLVRLAIGLPLVMSAVYSQAASYVSAGNVSVTWKIDSFIQTHPANPKLTNVTFPFTLNEPTLRKSGTYFAQQFYFDNPNGGSNTAYTGFQPRQDKNGNTRIHAVFSSFIGGTTSTDKNCSKGADGGSGVSCATEFNGAYGHTYNITVRKVTGHTWEGVAKDTVTGEETHIGSFTVPSTLGDLDSSGLGFAEYYAYYESGYPQFVVPTCSKLAKIDVIYGAPTTTDYMGGIGPITNPYEYGTKDCKASASGYSAQKVSEAITAPTGQKIQSYGQRIIRGFISN